MPNEQQLVIKDHEVFSTLRKLKQGKASGPDNLSSKVLKLCARPLSPIFCTLFNMSLNLCKIPSSWKTSKIIPVPKSSSVSQMNDLRLHVADQLGLRDGNVYAPLWVIDFPLLEWDEDTARYHAMHHPFTSPKPEDLDKLESAPGEVKANAYDLVINGTEIGGGSIRIHDKEIQSRMFDLLGFTKEEAKAQFGFLMDAFEYGAPPHGGIAFGFDRLCSTFMGKESIRDFIAFPKNNSGRDVMIDAPSLLENEQLEELNIAVTALEKQD